MARRFQTGYETGDVTAAGSITKLKAVPDPTVVAASPPPRTGSAYCLKCGPFGSTFDDPDTKCAQRYAHGTLTEVWYSFGLYVSNATEDTLTYVVVFRNLDSAGNANISVRFDGGTLRVYRATAGLGQPTQAQMTLLGSASVSIAQTTWALVEVRFLASGTAAVGVVEVWINGVQALNVTGVQTTQSGAATVNASEFELGYTRVGGDINGCSTTAYAAFDDVRVNDTTGALNTGRPGDESVRLLIPAGAGDLTAWTRGGADSGANYSQVDETPPNGSTDFVQAAAVGDTDLYNTTDFAVSSISAITVIAQASNSDGSGGTLSLPTKTGAGQSDGAAQSLSASWGYLSRLLETDPADAGVWTSAKLAALQIGVKVAS